MKLTRPILVIGAAGQVAKALAARGAIDGHALTCLGRPDLDLADLSSVEKAFSAAEPALVINAAAYTAVDRAETDSQAAFMINAKAPEQAARLCAERCIPIIQLSTDYVFDGTKRTPYLEEDTISPLSVYGQSKAAGEAGVRARCAEHLIVRTSWVYSAGGQNFLKTMLRLGSERDTLRIVADQHGAPTFADDIAQALSRMASRALAEPRTVQWGTYHLTNGGQTTWYGFAEAIFDGWKGDRTPPRLEPIPTSEYPTAAQRPAYSVLDNGKVSRTFGVVMPSWEDGLARCLRQLRAEQGNRIGA
jgi:dTDP-4-dehydrorhamnose reductase